ncbi:MAG: MCE family protein [Deltaproteobacteria bacterium]|nr:MCE family protein [Deltaproteobacteria bacterium]
MAKKTANFMLGLFVILGFFLGVAAIIWVGATSFFQKGQTYITYFDESVQGLQGDSNVKYRGVDVGRVEKIRVAPDNRLIGVVIKVNLRDDLAGKTVAQLKAAGITGIMFIELDRRKPDEPDLSPKLTFPSEYPVIPSRPSEIQRILSKIDGVVAKLEQIDTRGISDQLKATGKAVEDLFKGKEMEKILVKLGATAANLDDLTKRVDKIIASGKAEDVLVESRETLKVLRTLVANVKEEIQAMKLSEIGREAESATANLRRASEALDKFLERISDRPPDLLFGKPPPKRWNE